jgi:hypothetical protein
MYETRNYLIFNVSELSKINFNEVLETSADTVRRSVDGTKTFVKWAGDRPQSTYGLITAEGPYNHNEILELLQTQEWTSPAEMTTGA